MAVEECPKLSQVVLLPTRPYAGGSLGKWDKKRGIKRNPTIPEGGGSL